MAEVNMTSNFRGFPAKLPEPPTFSGDSEKYLAWEIQIELYLGNIGIDVNDSVQAAQARTFVLNLLRGNASQWLAVRKLQNNVLATFSELLTALRTKYQHLDYETRARDQLQSLVQKSSVTKYIELFDNLIMQIPGLNTKDLIHQFTYGLKHHIRTQVRARALSSIEEVQQAALHLEGLGYTNIPSRNTFKQMPHNQSQSQKHNANDSYTPMELGNIYQRRGQSSRSQFGNRKPKQMLCFHCGKPGHFKRDCYSLKNQGSSTVNNIFSGQGESFIPEDVKNDPPQS